MCFVYGVTLVQDKRLKIYKIISLIAGGISLVCAVWLCVLWAIAGWKFFFIKPMWLGFLLLMIFGISLMVLCVTAYLQMCLKTKLAETVVCESCGAECHCSSAFCPSCGAKFEKDE